MKERRRVAIWSMGLMLVLGVGCSQKSTPEPVWVGHVAPLSGADKAIGEQEKQAILLAVEEANQEDNLIEGRKVSVDHADSLGGEATRAVVRRLLIVNRVAALLGGAEVAQVHTLTSLTRTHAAPSIVGTRVPTGAVGEYDFFTGMQPAWQGKVLARFAIKELKKSRLAMITDGSGIHAVVFDAFAAELPKTAVLGRWTYPLRDKREGVPEDSKTWRDKRKEMLEELLVWKPEIVVFAGASTDFVELSRTGFGMQAPLLYAGEEGLESALRDVPVPVPVYLATAFTAEVNTSSAKAFSDKYRERFGAAPEVRAALAYDDARLLFQAMRDAKTPDGAKVRDALLTIKFEGLTGPLSFDIRHSVARPLFVVGIENGKSRLRERYEPEKK